MARYALDAATLLHIADNALTVHPGHQLVAPNAIRSEVMQLLLDEARAGRRSDRAALQIHDRITGVRMRLLGDRVTRRVAWQIARRQGWDTLRDAEHLAVAQLQADALVTVDPGLTARAKGIVPTAPLEVLLAGA